jgi:hypothetical protein
MEALMSEQRLWQCSVYVISDGHGNMKIGVAKDVRARIKTLQVGNAHPLQLLFEVVCTSPHVKEAPWACYQIEHAMHGSLEHLRMTGEWFALEYFEAFNELEDCIANSSDHPLFERYKISVSDVLVHVSEKNHIWYWPTSDVHERGMVH